MSAVSTEAQLRYLLQWFGEFSELQREDFLPVLVATRTGRQDALAGQLAALSCTDKPVSLFQCRIKLFNEWYPTWSEEEQDRLIKGVSDMDPEFGKKLEEQLTNGVTVNGDTNGIDGNTRDDEQENLQNNQFEIVDASADAENGVLEQVVPDNNIPLEIAAAS
ncbi:Uncharacterized protein C14orf119 [Eumeta japonica]|uniref:Uncharacterized protein C14orf119 n=1 Tax=Eumeta variegata TaxID=151549 RepID=A0A4C1SQ35_EUMVA|nr:Uncharacterized protein C14orf119 [Eumeta japonica]